MSASPLEILLKNAREYGVEHMQLPPPCFVEMQGEFIHFDADTATLVARFPVQQRYENPMRFMQGGFLAAALDNTIGPLSFLVAPPSVTSSFNVSYLRPITPEMAHFTVEATVTERTRRNLYFVGKALSPDGKTLAIANAVQQIVDRGDNQG